MQEIPTVQQQTPPQQPVDQQQPPIYPQQPYQEYPAPPLPYYGQPYYGPPVPPSKKKMRPGMKPFLWSVGIFLGMFVLLVAIFSVVLTPRPSGQALVPVQPTQQVTTQPVPTLAPTEVPQPTPTVVPQPTQSPAQTEKAFKSSTQAATIATLDKEGSSYYGKNVYFTCTILDFVKDSDGNTAGANVDDPNTSGVVQVLFPSGTNLDKLNVGDTLEVWGIDDGVFSGTNAYGGTVQEVGVEAMYMTDQTTGYATH